MAEQYGFDTEDYGDGLIVESLTTGDGKAEFCDISYEDGTVAVSIGYGAGVGVGVKRDHNEPMNKEMGIKWLVRFESQGSIDAMIETLLRCKNRLSK